MAFECIFGDKAVPGSEIIYQTLHPIDNRTAVQVFRQELRTRVAGGDQAVRDLKRRICELEVEGVQLKNSHKYQQAYNAFVAATNFRGGLTASNAAHLVDCLCCLIRYDEAHSIVRIYSQISYVKGEALELSEATRKLLDDSKPKSLTKSSLKSVLLKMMSTGLKKVAHDYDPKIVPTHLTALVDLLSQNDAFFKENAVSIAKDFIPSSVLFLSVMMKLFEKMADADIFELIYAGFFFRLVIRCYEANPAAKKAIVAIDHFQEIYEVFSLAIISHDFFKRLASWERHEPVAFFLHRFLDFIDTLIGELHFVVKGKVFGNSLVMCLFSGENYQAEIENVSEFSAAMLLRMHDAFQRDFGHKPLPNFEIAGPAKSIDLLLAYETIANAEWYATAEANVVQYGNMVEETITREEVGELAVETLIFHVKNNLQFRSTILLNPSYFTILSTRLMPAFLNKTMPLETLNVEFTTKLLKTFSLCFDGHLSAKNREKAVKNIVTMPEFFDNFFNFFEWVFTLKDNKHLKELIGAIVEVSFVIFATATEFALKKSEFLNKALEFQLITEYPPLLAAIVRNFCRPDESMLVTTSMTKIAAHQLKKLCSDNLETSNINVLYRIIALHAFVDGGKPIISFDSLLKVADCGGNSGLKRLAERLIKVDYNFRKIPNYNHVNHLFTACCGLLFASIWRQSKRFRDLIRREKGMLDDCELLVNNMKKSVATIGKRPW